MASQEQKFPVRVTKGTGDDKVTRTAHSPIALSQLKTEGFQPEGGKSEGGKQAKSQARPQSRPQAQPAQQKAADEAADDK